jgi:hypothetical protein
VYIPTSARKEKWLIMLFNLCSQFSGVAGLLLPKQFCFAGDEIGVNVAKELYEYLKNEINRLLKNENINGRKAKSNFRIGCLFSVKQKMEQVGGWRDMQIKRQHIREKYFSELKNYPGRKRKLLESDIRAGMESGENININRQAGIDRSAGLITET